MLFLERQHCHDVRADIVLTGVNIADAAANKPIIVEAKKRTKQAFNQAGNRRKDADQIRDYQNHMDSPSPYSILFNFEANSANVQFRWAKSDQSEGSGGIPKMTWHEYSPPS